MSDNTYGTINGERYTTKQIKRKTDATKADMLERQRMAIGYNVCTICWENDCKPIDCSHHIPEKKAKENGRAELCWASWNMQIIGRPHHKEKDGLNLQFNAE